MAPSTFPLVFLTGNFCFLLPLYTQQMAAHIINKQKLTAMPRSFKHYIGHDIKAFGNATVTPYIFLIIWSFLFVSIARLNRTSVYIYRLCWKLFQKCCSTHWYNRLEWPGITGYTSPVVRTETRLLRMTSLTVDCVLQWRGSLGKFFTQI